MSGRPCGYPSCCVRPREAHRPSVPTWQQFAEKRSPSSAVAAHWQRRRSAGAKTVQELSQPLHLDNAIVNLERQRYFGRERWAELEKAITPCPIVPTSSKLAASLETL